MLAGAISKTVASCMAYPHEVARTRLREEGDKYNTFFQTLRTVWREEGRAGLYRLVKNILSLNEESYWLMYVYYCLFSFEGVWQRSWFVKYQTRR